MSYYLSPSSPFFALFASWLLVLAAFQLKASYLLVPPSIEIYSLLLFNAFTLLLIGSFFYLKVDKIKKIQIDDLFRKRTAFALSIYLCFEFFQMCYFKGFPLYWLFSGDSRVYVDYGISSLNGAFHALYLLSMSALFLIWMIEGGKYRLYTLIICACIPVFLLSRQVFISLFIQMGAIALLINPKAWKKCVLGGIVVLALFVILGNSRTGLNTLVVILEPAEWVPEFFYPLLWIYAYITTPLNNLHGNIEGLYPLYEPLHEINSIFPTVFSSFLPEIEYNQGFDLVHRNLTVSTFYLEPILDFGLGYAAFFMAGFQVILCAAYRRAVRDKRVEDVLMYAVFYMIAVLSVFSNLLLFLPIIFQLALLFFLRPSRKQSTHQNI